LFDVPSVERLPKPMSLPPLVVSVLNQVSTA
jgi:hypothetical protein